MYFLIQIISTLSGMKADRKVMVEKDKAPRREQRRNETWCWRKGRKWPSKGKAVTAGDR